MHGKTLNVFNHQGKTKIKITVKIPFQMQLYSDRNTVRNSNNVVKLSAKMHSWRQWMIESTA